MDVLDLLDGPDPERLAKQRAKDLLVAKVEVDRRTGGFLRHAESQAEFDARLQMADEEIRAVAEAHVGGDVGALRNALAQEAGYASETTDRTVAGQSESNDEAHDGSKQAWTSPTSTVCKQCSQGATPQLGPLADYDDPGGGVSTFHQACYQQYIQNRAYTAHEEQRILAETTVDWQFAASLDDGELRDFAITWASHNLARDADGKLASAPDEVTERDWTDLAMAIAANTGVPVHRAKDEMLRDLSLIEIREGYRTTSEAWTAKSWLEQNIGDDNFDSADAVMDWITADGMSEAESLGFSQSELEQAAAEIVSERGK